MNNGFSIHEVNPFYVQAVAEHRELHAELERIRRVLDNGAEVDATDDRVAETVRLVGLLRDHLKRHFEQEERGGYLEEAIAKCPKIAPQAETLQSQHGEFLVLLERLLAGTADATTNTNRWAKLRSGFLPFAKRLNAHEAAEEALLHRAFNEDAGV